MQISDLKWIAVWCIQYKVLFGHLNFPESEAGTDQEESKEEQEESKDYPSSEPMYFNGELLAEYQPMEWRH